MMKTALVTALVLAGCTTTQYTTAPRGIDCVLQPGSSCTISMPAGSTPPPTEPPPVIPPPITPPPVPANCKVMDMSWSNPTRLYTSAVGGFNVGDMIAVRFRTPNNGTAGSLPRMAAAEYQGPPLSRNAAISTQPCDFTPAAKNLAGTGVSVTLVFAILPGTNSYYGSLQQNTVYYMNMKNDNEQGGNMFIDLVGSLSCCNGTKAVPKATKKAKH